MRAPRILVVGSLNMDIVVEAPRPPKMGETILGDKVHFIPGGKGANQAVAAARLGAQTTMIGAIGRDGFGQELLEALKKEGIHTGSVKEMAETHTGVASILLAERDNQIIVVPGANAFCVPDDIEKHEQLIAEADIVLIQLEIPLTTVEKTAELAKKHGRKVLLNPAPAQSLSKELLQRVDILTPNESELALLAGNGEIGDIGEAMSRLMEMGVGQVITTLGSEGAAYLNKEGILCKVPPRTVEVVDTTGAGDAFNAGLAYGLAVDMDLADAVDFAGKVSALAVTKLGAQAGMPLLEAVQKLYE